MTVQELYNNLYPFIEKGLGHKKVMISHEDCEDFITTVFPSPEFEEVYMDKSSIKEGKNDGDYYSDFEDILNPKDYDKVLLIHCL